LNSLSPSSIVVGNGSSLPITSVGDSVLPEPFYLNNILLAPDIVQNFLFVRCFTTDNWCFMGFNPFDLFVKDLTTLPPGPFFCQNGHNSGCRVLTRLLRMIKPNTSFASLTKFFARCLSRLPFPGTIGLKGFTMPHIY
jgi:hypothetical protein